MSYVKKIMNTVSDLYKEAFKLYFSCVNSYPLRLIDSYSDSKTNKNFFIVQFVGKNVCPHFSADELAVDKKILENFSPIDRKVILFSAKETIAMKDIVNHNQYRFVAINFDRETNQTLYVFKKNDNNACFETKFTASELMNNSEVMQSLDECLAKSIILQAGREDILSFKP